MKPRERFYFSYDKHELMISFFYGAYQWVMAYISHHQFISPPTSYPRLPPIPAYAILRGSRGALCLFSNFQQQRPSEASI